MPILIIWFHITYLTLISLYPIMPTPPLSDEDKALFRQSVGEVKPITPNRRLGLGPTKNRMLGQGPTYSRVTQSPLKTASIYLSDTTQTNLTGEAILFYNQTPLEKNHLQRLKQGLLPIEGTLDLHGLFAEQAKNSLVQFIENHTRLKHRLLLIVHGKGQHGKIPLLKNLVNHWLPQLPHVLAFVSAKPKDGGTGAVYVLLKRA
ncbi:MAG: Smr/MutS family protein [Gammaproteobacteria bacterium]|nr:Smr/MutS family protein [Gammaproteobacteria bacterium]